MSAPNLTEAQCRYLSCLARGGDMRKFNTLRARRTRNALVKRGLITRLSSPGDGRSRYAITEAGRNALLGEP
jgi:DNA-binding MarR family transcriptional regulator